MKARRSGRKIDVGRVILAYCLTLAGLAAGQYATAQEAFTIEDIRVQGLRRISRGTVFTYLPVKPGDRFDPSRSADIILSLFRTGFFRDVRLLRSGNVLVVDVVERPTIALLRFEGNEDINDENLQKGLEQAGFAKGKTYNRQLLDRIVQDLRRQYFNRGKYGVEIRPQVTELDDNRVSITLRISEGVTAKIARIKIVGNRTFPDKDLLGLFELKTTNLISAVTSADQYSRQKLSADLEKLRSYYLDRGYIKFDIESTQVEISPDRREIYITINVKEGDVYTIEKIDLSGNLVVKDPQELVELVTVNPGDVFSRKKISETTDAISKRLGDEGYIFSNVNMVPEINDDARTVRVGFVIDPGRQAYVRRINFRGNTKTRDEVLRREMRQLEAASASNRKIEDSKSRLERLGYFEEVNVETVPVPGASDQIDLNYTVTERPSGSLLAGLGFSQTQGIIFNFNINQDNLLGSGKRVNLAFNNSDVTTLYRIGYFNPYFTIDGISSGFDLSFRQTDAAAANLSQYSTDEFLAGFNLGIPLNEKDRLRFNIDFRNTKINTFGTRAVDTNGDGVLDGFPTDTGGITPTSARGDTPLEIFQFIEDNGEEFATASLSLGWSRDTRDRAIFPTSGAQHRLSFLFTVPGSDLEYYKADYRVQTYVPLTSQTTLALAGEVAYGDGYGDTDGLPFFENFFAGGFNSVRGFDDNTLGPRDSSADGGLPFGGASKIEFSTELQFPVPFGDIKSVRFGPFFDGGNVFAPDRFDVGELRFSTGVFARWLSPFGALGFSIAQPLNAERNDDEQVFQFSFGAGLL